MQIIHILGVSVFSWIALTVLLSIIHSMIPSSSYVDENGIKTFSDGTIVQIMFLPVILSPIAVSAYLRIRKKRGSEPFFFESLSKKETSDIFYSAKISQSTANTTRDLNTFFESYNEILFCFKQLSKRNCKGLKGNPKQEYTRLLLEQEKHAKDAIDRCGKAIIDDYNGIYRYENDYIEDKIYKYAQAIEWHSATMGRRNLDYAKTYLRYIQKHCKISIEENLSQGKSYNAEGYKQNTMDIFLVDKMDGHQFEHWCASLLLKSGFSKAEVTPGSGDHGVDIVAEKDGVNYAVQCKCYHSDLGNTPVQEVFAGKEMYGCQVGVVMTNRYFTKGAKDLSAKTKTLLWDRDTLQNMIQKSSE